MRLKNLENKPENLSPSKSTQIFPTYQTRKIARKPMPNKIKISRTPSDKQSTLFPAKDSYEEQKQASKTP